MIRLGLFLLLLASASPLFGQVRPIPGTGDPRLQTIAYNADQIVELSVASGYQLMVRFAPGERIETIAVGDSGAWQVTANKRGDYLFVKAIGEGRATNMTVVTDARVYAFELTQGTSFGGDQAFSVRFTYPEETAQARSEKDSATNYRYRLSGARALRPSLITQKGQTLVIEWPESAALPAIFKIEEDGQETLVNGEMKDGAFRVMGLPKKLVFRLDRGVATATRVKIKAKNQ